MFLVIYGPSFLLPDESQSWSYSKERKGKWGNNESSAGIWKLWVDLYLMCEIRHTWLTNVETTSDSSSFSSMAMRSIQAAASANYTFDPLTFQSPTKSKNTFFILKSFFFCIPSVNTRNMYGDLFNNIYIITLFEKSNFCPKIQFWQNPNIFTSFSPKFFLTIFLVKSKLSTAKNPKTPKPQNPVKLFLNVTVWMYLIFIGTGFKEQGTREI